MSEFNERVEAVWCWDAETGQKYLLDLKTGQVLSGGVTLDEEMCADEVEVVSDYARGVEDGYAVAESELMPIIQDLEEEIVQLKALVERFGPASL